MSGDSGQEKTHQATERKRRQAAERGQIAKSRELNSAAILAAGAGTLIYARQPMADALRELMRLCMDASGPQIMEHGDAVALSASTISATATILAAPLGALVVAALFAGLAQTRFQLATKIFEPKFEKLNPIEGFSNHYMSWTPLVELAKGLLKIGALGAVAFYALRARVAALPGAAMMSPDQIGELMAELAWTLTLWSLPLILLVGVLDYAYQWWKVNEDLKMSTEEFKREHKEENGDPHQKATRRARARALVSPAALAEVRRADVVVTNPTHYAVAIRYRKGEAHAPVIVAMGVDHAAMKIKREARRHDVPQVENRPLARALHAKGKQGSLVPQELFGPVAQVLAAIYRRRASGDIPSS